MNARLRWVAATAAAGSTFVAVFLFYFLIYRVRHFSLPLGFDAPWYVWRANFVASQGLGPLDTNARPGHALLSADLQSLTGLSALRMHVVLPYVLVAIFALAMGAFVAEGLGRGERWRWAIGAGVAGGLVGTTRLVGENVANLMNVMLVAVGLLFLVRYVERRRGFLGAVLMLIAAGLAHWLFLGVLGLGMVVWLGLAWFRDRREARAVFGAGAATGVAMAAIIFPVLHSSLRTIELHEPKRRYYPKLREDLGALRTAFTGPLAALGVWAIAKDRDQAARGPFLRMLTGWTVVAGGGLAVAAATRVVQPHRFLTLLVAGPVVVAVAAALAYAARWIRARAGRALAIAFGVLAVAAVAVSAGVNWYRESSGPKQFWDATAFQQAREANAYIATLGPERPVVFLVSPLGPFGAISTAEKERVIRAAIDPSRQENVYVYPGDLSHLSAGTFTPTGQAEFDRENRMYFEGMRSVLDDHPVVLMLAAFAPPGRVYAPRIASGVFVLRGPDHDVPRLAVSRPVPRTEAGTAWAILIGVLLFVAGIGWTAWFVGPRVPPLTLVALSPAVGTGMVMLAALVTAKAGLELGGTAGVATFAAVAVAGPALWLVSARRQSREQGTDGG